MFKLYDTGFILKELFKYFITQNPYELFQWISIQDAAASESSSDWDCQSEKCPICLAKFSQQVIGTPESCDHCFCLDCIQEWAKVKRISI